MKIMWKYETTPLIHKTGECYIDIFTVEKISISTILIYMALLFVTVHNRKNSLHTIS